MNIPALIQIDIQEEWNGKMAVIDGFSGEFYIDPEPEILEKYQAKKKSRWHTDVFLQSKKENRRSQRAERRSNCLPISGSVSDLPAAMSNDAGGIGLFRSEFLYLESETYPTEDEQFKAYKMVAETMAGKKVIIRTLDIGADKQVDYFDLDKEENPAMGLRAILYLPDETGDL